MDNFDMAMALIKEAQEEKERHARFIKELAGCDFDDWKAKNDVYRRYSPTPHLTLVKDNLKMARRLLKKEYM